MLGQIFETFTIAAKQAGIAGHNCGSKASAADINCDGNSKTKLGEFGDSTQNDSSTASGSRASSSQSSPKEQHASNTMNAPGSSHVKDAKQRPYITVQEYLQLIRKAAKKRAACRQQIIAEMDRELDERKLEFKRIYIEVVKVMSPKSSLYRKYNKDGITYLFPPMQKLAAEVQELCELSGVDKPDSTLIGHLTKCCDIMESIKIFRIILNMQTQSLFVKFENLRSLLKHISENHRSAHEYLDQNTWEFVYKDCDSSRLCGSSSNLLQDFSGNFMSVYQYLFKNWDASYQDFITILEEFRLQINPSKLDESVQLLESFSARCDQEYKNFSVDYGQQIDAMYAKYKQQVDSNNVMKILCDSELVVHQFEPVLDLPFSPFPSAIEELGKVTAVIHNKLQLGNMESNVLAYKLAFKLEEMKKAFHEMVHFIIYHHHIARKNDEIAPVPQKAYEIMQIFKIEMPSTNHHVPSKSVDFKNIPEGEAFPEDDMDENLVNINASDIGIAMWQKAQKEASDFMLTVEKSVIKDKKNRYFNIL